MPIFHTYWSSLYPDYAKRMEHFAQIVELSFMAADELELLPMEG